MSEFVIIYATFPNESEAQSIGEDLVERRLAACVNIFPSVTSIYQYGDQFHREREVAVFIKTSFSTVESVIAEVKRLHSYETPAIVTIPVQGGDMDYLNWLKGQVQ